jgi:hypothetical protein
MSSFWKKTLPTKLEISDLYNKKERIIKEDFIINGNISTLDPVVSDECKKQAKRLIEHKITVCKHNNSLSMNSLSICSAKILSLALSLQSPFSIEDNSLGPVLRA